MDLLILVQVLKFQIFLILPLKAWILLILQNYAWIEGKKPVRKNQINKWGNVLAYATIKLEPTHAKSYL